jgi:hypothetical protein
MVAFTYRMGAGFAGDVNRAHPFSIAPAIPLAATPPTLYGQAVIADAGGAGVRPIVAGDSAVTDLWGITVRPYPLQPASATNYGQVSLSDVPIPPTNQIIDLLSSGYIFVKVNGTPVQGGRVYIWYAVASGAHVQGGFEAANTGGSTLQLNDRYYFNGGPDASGICELRCNA